MMKHTPGHILIGEWGRDEIDIISRWYRLRKMGLLYPIIHTTGFNLYTLGPLGWDGKESLSWEKLEADVKAAESVIITVKKEPQSCNAPIHYADLRQA